MTNDPALPSHRHSHPPPPRPVYGSPALDNDPEVAYDSLARMAAHAFRVSTAIISLPDSNQIWFSSSLQSPVPGMERRIAFLMQALGKPAETVVCSDLSADPRFAVNPLVAASPCLRFYAVAPVVSLTGNNLGFLILADTDPRQLSDLDLASLTDFARVSRACIESVSRQTELKNLALTDPVTGLSNLLAFQSVLDSQVSFADRSGQNCTLLLLEVQGLGKVNDLFGAGAVEEVLVEVARRVAPLIRGSEKIARTGLCTLAVLLRGGDASSASALHTRLVETTTRPVTLSSGHRVSYGLVCGVATTGPEITSGRELMFLAQQRLAGSQPPVSAG
jgi:diguanylate cyclase (GGDEF)-like protein